MEYALGYSSTFLFVCLLKFLYFDLNYRAFKNKTNESAMSNNFIIFPIVGAAIGALTNEIAIKMLFRPYKEKRLLGIRVPFTPGVIPAQRHTIAKNIAETFEQNLLSGDEIHKIITGEKVHGIISTKVDEMFASFGPMAAMFSGLKPKVVDKIISGIEEVADSSIASGGDLHIGEKIENKINAMDVAVLEELVLGFSRKQFKHITFFGGVLGFVIGLVQATIAFYTM
jgi:uncharacterized membrane protein YheB (UPF0754 family)